ncbi:MAG: hypothetical protein P3W91_000715 [Fervidobacterium sp.]|nr:hypothetical protein [Fervidobacterium sp.]
MKKYVYEGPLTAVTIGGVDYILYPNSVVELDENNEYVQTLIAMGRLKEVKEEQKTKKKGGE